MAETVNASYQGLTLELQLNFGQATVTLGGATVGSFSYNPEVKDDVLNQYNAESGAIISGITSQTDASRETAETLVDRLADKLT